MGRKAKMKRDRHGNGGPAGGPRRRQWPRRWMVGVAVVLLAAGGAGAWFWSGADAVPEPAPRFNLMASTGEAITLDAFLGKQEVVLIFYMGAG